MNKLAAAALKAQLKGDVEGAAKINQRLAAVRSACMKHESRHLLTLFAAAAVASSSVDGRRSSQNDFSMNDSSSSSKKAKEIVEIVAPLDEHGRLIPELLNRTSSSRPITLTKGALVAVVCVK